MSFLTSCNKRAGAAGTFAKQYYQSATILSRFTTSSTSMAASLNSENISKIGEKEFEITGENSPVKGGPTAQAQKHAGQTIDSQTLHQITEGEKKITGGERVADGPTATAQSILTKANQANNRTQADQSHTGKLDSSTISKINASETEITGSRQPVRGGPTAKAQSHVGEPINSQNLHDITEGEKKITGGERVKGGPTAAVQSELGKSRE